MRMIYVFLITTIAFFNTAKAEVEVQSGLNGMWITDSSGQGAVFQVAKLSSGPSLVVTWYAYQNGQQVWLLGSQPFEYGVTEISVPMHITSGANWGDDFLSDDVIVTEWGTLALNFSSCDSGTMTYNSNDETFGSGVVDLIRLTRTDGLECNEDVAVTEEEGLKFMREEEKLARDIYLKLFRDYGVNVFSNIAASEQTHMDAVLDLMEQYNIPDSSTGVEGTYNNLELQALYELLVSIADQGLVQAYLVGALIEETDIRDIEIYKDISVSENVIAVYDNLLCGSRNHLRSFVARYESETGLPYIAQIPELADMVDSILNTEQEQCGRP